MQKIEICGRGKTSAAKGPERFTAFAEGEGQSVLRKVALGERGQATHGFSLKGQKKRLLPPQEAERDDCPPEEKKILGVVRGASNRGMRGKKHRFGFRIWFVCRLVALAAPFCAEKRFGSAAYGTCCRKRMRRRLQGCVLQYEGVERDAFHKVFCGVPGDMKRFKMIKVVFQ